MCTKPYSKTMASYLDELDFRLDFYSLPQFLISFTNVLKKYLGEDIEFAQRVLTGDEMYTIDTDSVSDALNCTIEDITSKKCYVFSGKTHEMNDVKIYLHPYFLFIQFKEKIQSELHPNECSLFQDICSLTELRENTDIQQITCIMNHNAKCIYKPEDISSVIDKDAFPSLQFDDRYKGGSYSDEYELDDCVLSLVRNLEVNDGNLYIGIHSVSVYKDTNMDELFNKSMNVIHETNCEISKCFKQ